MSAQVTWSCRLLAVVKFASQMCSLLLYRRCALISYRDFRQPNYQIFVLFRYRFYLFQTLSSYLLFLFFFNRWLLTWSIQSKSIDPLRGLLAWWGGKGVKRVKCFANNNNNLMFVCVFVFGGPLKGPQRPVALSEGSAQANFFALPCRLFDKFGIKKTFTSGGWSTTTCPVLSYLTYHCSFVVKWHCDAFIGS